MTNFPTPLAKRLIERIGALGPMSIAEYMATCLSDPQHGYYVGRDPFGRAGDFITAPEISQIFGELIGLWCVSVWLEMGSPSRFALAELGPGRGTLLADGLRAAALRPAFAEATNVLLLEISPTLRAVQREALNGLAEPNWIDRIDDLPPGPTIVIANEFFDALPIRQFVRDQRGWAERMVGIDDRGQLAFGLGPIADLGNQAQWPLAMRVAPLGSEFELRPAAEAIVETLSARIAADGGAALIMDYGHAEPGLGDTLQAIHSHQYDHPLAHPGEADLTAHVDFAALAHTATTAGAKAWPIIDQATLLSRLGLDERADRLAQDKNAQTKASIAAALARLTDKEQMGRLFKTLAISTPGLAVPAF